MRQILQATALFFSISASAQSVGSVAAQDATVTAPNHRTITVVNSRVNLVGGEGIVALDRSAQITLVRGGVVELCRTSSLHLAGNATVLSLGLDRGAMELRTLATPGDAILTPDLRLTMPSGGPLDLRLRVSTNGDTCVENRGHRAPALQLTDAYGQARYLLRPGQHVLFEHGSLREVVDRETTPCGCPPEEPRALPLNQAQLSGSTTVTPAQSAAAYPFPVAQSAGLAPAPPLPADRIGQTNTQVSTTFAVDPSAARTPQANPPPISPSPAPATARSHNPFRAIGQFFHRLFVR